MQTTINGAPPSNADEVAVMSWLDHARELRDRLFKATLAVLLGVLVGFYAVTWNDYAVVDYLVRHLAPDGAQTMKVGEAFTNVLKLALGIGVALGMPVIVYQLLAFVVPALTSGERKIIFTMLPFVMLCFIAGLSFGWFVTVPAAFGFLLNFGPDIVENKPTLEYFLSLFTRLMLLNGLLFELPVIVYAVIWLGAVDRKTLTSYRRYSILVIVILSSIITPTGDPVNLAFTAVPMYLLYELGLLLAWIAPRRRPPAAV